MKLSLALVSLMAAASSAFVIPSTTSMRSARMQLAASAVRPDASAAIQAALEASKKYGPTSPEARVAWDAVEEMDASDNSEAAKGTIDEECNWLDESNRLCMEYDTKKEQLAAALKAFQDESIQNSLARMKSLAEEMQAIKLATAKPKITPSSPELTAALEKAKKAQAEFGAGSSEAKLAWEELEEIAARGFSSAIGKRLDEECLVESTMEACMALEELGRVLTLEKTKGDTGLNS